MKIIRLTESDLTNIVKRVISENDSITEKKYKTYSKLLNKLTEKFDWVSKIDVKLSSGGWIGEESKPLLIVSVYFKNYQKIRMMTQFELFDEISFIHDMFFPHLTGDPRIYSDNVTAYFSVKSVFPNGKTGFFPIQIVSGDYDDVSQISESQLTNIVKRVISENNSMTDKNKKFLNNLMGMDFTGKIKQVTSTYDVPMEFDDVIGPDGIRRYLNFWGPMYLIEIDGMRFLYQDRVDTDGRFEWFLGEDGIDYVDNEIIERLGIDVMGLRFSDILDMYFNEEESLNEDVDKNKRFLKNKLGIDFTNGIQQITSTYDVPMEFDRYISTGMINRYLNKFGPMYLFELDGYKYLYLDVGVHEKFIDEKGNVFIENEIPERLGIDIMGLRFSNIIDLYFKEEDF